MALQHKLPLELLNMIYLEVLNDMDITTVPEKPILADLQGCGVCETLRFHVLDPIKLAYLNCCTELLSPPALGSFAWAEHVRFVFPSIVAMADVFCWFQDARQLQRIRRVKVFHRAGYGFMYQSWSWMRTNIWIFDILRNYKNLRLDHLECETQTGLLEDYYRMDLFAPATWLCLLLKSPGWKRLSVLNTSDYLSDDFVNRLAPCLDYLKSVDSGTSYTFHLPGAQPLPNIDNGVWSTNPPMYSRPWPMSATTDLSRNSIPSWLGGVPVRPAIVIQRESYGLHDQPQPPLSGCVSMWYDGDRNMWKECRSSNEHPHGRITVQGIIRHTCERGRERREEMKLAAIKHDYTISCICPDDEWI